MKLSAITAASTATMLLVMLSSKTASVTVAAFVPAVHTPLSRRAAASADAQQSSTQLTAQSADAAKSKEEDLELTRKVIHDFMGDDLSESSQKAVAAQEKKESAYEEE